MTGNWAVSVRIHRAAWIGLLLLMPLSACQTLKPRSTPTEPPRVACEQKTPAEPAPDVDATSESWRYWYEQWLRAMGLAASEVQKRATTAQCLDRLEKSGVIRQ